MSGALKAGLLLGFIGFLVTIPVHMINLYFAGLPNIICGPLIACVTGAVAGFLGAHWGTTHTGVGAGTIAGAVVGMVLIFGRIIPSILLYAIEIPDYLPTYLLSTPTDLCLGTIRLLFALSFGTLGGWIAVRSRPQMAEHTPQPSPPPTTPMH